MIYASCIKHKRSYVGKCEACESNRRVQERDDFFASWVKSAVSAGWYGPNTPGSTNAATPVKGQEQAK